MLQGRRGCKGWWLLLTEGQVTVGQWLLSPRLPQLRQQQPPGINMQTTYKIRKHHRVLDPSCLALGISVNAQSSRGGIGKVSL